MEQLDYNLLFRWIVGLWMDTPVWDATTLGKNRERLLDGDVAQRLLAAVVAQPRVAAGPATPAGHNGEQDWRGQKRSNETHRTRPIPMPGLRASRTGSRAS